jgi:hypothetical protein
MIVKFKNKKSRRIFILSQINLKICFKDFEWDRLEALELPAPYIPKLDSLSDTTHFDQVLLLLGSLNRLFGRERALWKQAGVSERKHWVSK